MTSLDGATQHFFLAAYKAQLPWICTLENVLKKSSFWALVILSVRSKASIPSIGWKFGKCHHGKLELWRLTSKGFSLQAFQKWCQWTPVLQAICLIQICKKKTLLVHVCKRLVKENITDLKSLFLILVTRLLLAVLDIIGSYGKFWAKEGLWQQGEGRHDMLT